MLPRKRRSELDFPRSIKRLEVKMSWAKGHSSLTENPFNKPIIDRCINCGDQEEVHTKITMEFGEGNYNSGPICKKCYSIHRGPRIVNF